MDKINKQFAKFKWAQNKECVFILIQVSDPLKYYVDIRPDYMAINGPNYKQLELFEEVDQSKSTYKINTSRNEIDVKLFKKNSNYWPQLYKQQSNLDKNWLSVDWDRWMPDYNDDNDDDEQKMKDYYDFNRMNPSSFDFDNDYDDPNPEQDHHLNESNDQLETIPDDDDSNSEQDDYLNESNDQLEPIPDEDPDKDSDLLLPSYFNEQSKPCIDKDQYTQLPPLPEDEPE